MPTANLEYNFYLLCSGSIYLRHLNKRNSLTSLFCLLIGFRINLNCSRYTPKPLSTRALKIVTEHTCDSPASRGMSISFMRRVVKSRRTSKTRESFSAAVSTCSLPERVLGSSIFAEMSSIIQNGTSRLSSLLILALRGFVTAWIQISFAVDTGIPLNL